MSSEDERMRSRLAEDISLSEVIRAVSDELVASRNQRLAEGQPPVFEVNSLDIELSITVTRSRSKGGGVDVKVVRGDIGDTSGNESVQRLALHLNSTILSKGEEEFESFDASSPLRPRREFRPRDS
jgi:hypothetical protein